MDRRVFGLETEYGVTCSFRGQRRLSPDEVARYLIRRAVPGGRSGNVFLRNGARLHLDTGGHPVYASHDMTGRSRVRLANGREMSALDIQREYLTKARGFAGSNGADPVSERVLELWERSLDSIEAGNLDAIAREIDWVIKYQLIERYRARHDLPLSSPRIAQLDLAYHDVHRSRGQYYQLQGSSAVERAVRDIDIFEAKNIPPILGN